MGDGEGEGVGSGGRRDCAAEGCVGVEWTGGPLYSEGKERGASGSCGGWGE